MKQRLKINGVIISLTVLLLVIFPRLFFRDAILTAADEFAKILGFACILLGQLFRVSARGFKAAHSRQGNALIQEGPYGLVRNPMYLGILLIGLGVVMMFFRWQAAVIFVSVFIWRYLPLTITEEKKLSSVFGNAYGQYCAKVPRLFPHPASLIKKDMKEYLPLEPRWIHKEIGSMSAVIASVFLAGCWRTLGNKGLKTCAAEVIGLIVVIALYACFVLHLTGKAENLKNDISNKSKSI